MNDTPQQHRPALNSLQAGRAFAALAVLLFHVELTLALPRYLGHDTFPVFRSGYSGVHFFFVLSGFVIMMAHGRDIGRPGRAPLFAWKRVRRIYPPLWAMLLLAVPATLLLPLLNNGAPFDILDVLSAVALTPATYDPVLSVIWTLRHEALFYAVFGLILLRLKVGLAVAALWMILSATLPWLGLDDWPRFFFTSQHLLFAFGAAAFLLFERGKVPMPALVTGAGLVLFGATWAIPLMKLPLNGIVANWAFGLGAALAVLGAASLERARGIPVPRWLVVLGEASYAIYLAHAPVVYAATAGALALIPQLRQAPIVLFVFVTAVSLCAGLAFHLWVERPLLARLPHSLPGGRGGARSEPSAP